MVSVVALAGLSPAAIAQNTPPQHHLTSAVTGKPLELKELAGRTIALHFVGDPTSAVAFVQGYLAQAPSVAGVSHIFIPSAEAAAAQAWAAQFDANAGQVYVDQGGALAAELRIAATPTTVVVGADGKELFRHAGSSPDDRLAFASFAKQLAERSKAPALADYNLPKGSPLAVQGYDVVAYFTNKAAIRGQPTLASTYRGVSYQFASAEHRRLFAADPEKYAPTYGGWCASAMGAKGTKVEIDPTNFKIKDGRLFLFYKGLLADALKDWNKHEAEWEPAADKNWKKLTNEDPAKPAH
jgi:YHS domain-containing protein